MHTLLVTVDYLHESFDLGLSADVPIREFLPILLEVCGLAQHGAELPFEDWELAHYSGAALPRTSSLQSCGVVDGMRLILRNRGMQESLETVPIAGRVHVFPYPPANADSGGPRVHWVHKDLMNE